MPKVSVIIPTYNGAQYIKQAVDSVLAQTYDDYEIIVVDDGSTDDTAELLRPYGDRITYLYQENRKLPAARNTGIRAARGQYLAFLDSDDLFLPHKLAAQARCLDERPEVGLVASGHQYIDEAGRLLQESRPWLGRPAITLESILFGGLAPVHAVLLRRDWFERVGGFDEQFSYCEDMDLWYRLALAGCPMVWEPAVVCQYRLHAHNMSRSPQSHFEYSRKALEKLFANPQLHDELRIRKAERLAHADLVEASRLLAIGEEGVARERILRATVIDPGLLDNEGWRLSEVVLGLKTDLWGDGRMPDFTISTLKEVIPGLQRTIAKVNAKKRFYTDYFERETIAVWRSWLDVARRDPRWLLDRGGLSILRQSISGFKDH